MQYNIKQVKGATQGSVLFLDSNGTVVENNGQLYWDNSNLRLGIGTVSTGAKLHVDGSFIVTNKINTTNHRLTAAGLNTIDWAACQLAYTVVTVDWASGILYSTTGNANIRWSSDIVKINTLNAVGDLAPADTFDLRIIGPADGSIGKGVHIKAYDGVSSWRTGLRYLNTSGTPNLLLVPDGFGNVGIGTASPTEKLDVVGNVRIGMTYSYNIGSYTAIKMSQASGAPNVSIGHSNTINDADNGGAIAIGSSVISSSDGIAIGLSSRTDTGNSDAIAIGREARAYGYIRNLAIGRAASAQADNAWAIGSYCLANQNDTIILGNAQTGNKQDIGIGTATVSARLHVHSKDSGSSNFVMKLENTSLLTLLSVRNDGLVTIAGLTGTGVRSVNVDASGNLIAGSASSSVVSKYSQPSVSLVANVIQTITHGLNTTNITVGTWDTSTGEIVYVTYKNRTTNSVDVVSTSSITVDIVIHG